MKIRPRRELLWTALAVAASGVTVVTCSTLGPSSPPHEPQAAASSSAFSALEALAQTSPPIASASAPLTEPAAPVQHTGRWAPPATSLGQAPDGNAYPTRLTHFYSALRSLQNGRAQDNVRVLWLGDSHTQADFWTDAMRSALQKQFGVGGPGFVHVGWSSGYRHAGVEFKTTGRWSIEPPTLVTQSTYDDGVFGLGGVRLMARGSDARATVRVNASALPSEGRWDMTLRFLRTGASLQVAVSGSAPVQIKADPAHIGELQHIALQTPGPGGELEVSMVWGEVQLMGVVVESAQHPGVVLDTLGLNGARYLSALSWDARHWQSEVARRKPDLVVMAFGTNESSNVKLSLEGHKRDVKALIGRLRAVAPQTDCLVFGPIDRPGKFSQVIQDINEAQRQAAQESGCAYWNAQLAMGGPGSMLRWAQSNPPLAASDKLHLHQRGYSRLGEALVQDLLTTYRAGTDAPEEPTAGAAAEGAEEGLFPSR